MELLVRTKSTVLRTALFVSPPLFDSMFLTVSDLFGVFADEGQDAGFDQWFENRQTAVDSLRDAIRQELDYANYTTPRLPQPSEAQSVEDEASNRPTDP